MTNNKPASKNQQPGELTRATKSKELVEQIFELRTQRLSYNAIAEQLGLSPKTVKKWYFEHIGQASPEDITAMRQEETLLNEHIIARCLADLDGLDSGRVVQPNWKAYEGNAVAHAAAYNAWLAALDRRQDAKIKIYNTLMKASRNIADLNGLAAPKQLQVNHSNAADVDEHGRGLDERINYLLKQMDEI